ncbi:MAG TPA: DUF3987 domain-containing protein [Bacteroidetes bacterium]|nr:hypothetical protein BMS3Bbin04_00061 [bacterium BMS3Bbin04]HDO66351.1 DUF3987 domain-containing protein [Bacteroidota bacterium]HEX05476.1 DUF3987 domain-containing protein [Bacteroidota bacterium]
MKDEHTAALKGREVYVLCDNDEAGFAHQLLVAHALHGKAARVYTVEPFDTLKGEGGDVTDWVNDHEREGRAQNEIAELIAETCSPLHRAILFDLESPPPWSIGLDQNTPKTCDLYDSSSWEEPLPLDTFDLRELPEDLLPPPLGPMVSAVARFIEVPPEIPALTIFAIVATAVQGKYRVQIREGHHEELSIWTMSLAESGERKTPTLDRLRIPLDKWKHDRAASIASTIREAKAKRELQERAIKILKEQIEIDDPDELQDAAYRVADMEGALSTIPVPPEIYSNDITPEELVVRMAENHGCMAIISDEAGMFDTLSGRYAQKGGVNLDAVNSGWNGGRVSSHRRSREAIHIERAYLSFALTVQPDAVSAMAEKERMRYRGFLPRFLFVIPRSRVGYRTNTGPAIPYSVQLEYESTIQALLDIEHCDSESDEDYSESTPRELTLSKQAFALFHEFWTEIEKQLRDGNTLEGIREWGNKFPGNIARIAGLLHLSIYAKSTIPSEIAASEMKTAIKFGSLLIPHALAAFNLLDEPALYKNARYLLGWIKRERLTTFKTRDAQRRNQRRFRQATLQPVLKELEERGYIRSGEADDPRVKIWEVNPCLFS